MNILTMSVLWYSVRRMERYEKFGAILCSSCNLLNVITKNQNKTRKGRLDWEHNFYMLYKYGPIQISSKIIRL